MASATKDVLPAVIVSPADVRRLRRDLEDLDDFLHQSSLRQGGKAVTLPRIGRQLDELASDAKANLLQKTHRQQLLRFLNDLNNKAPVLHMSFASEPSAAFMNKLVLWLRDNIHPQVLVRIGLQPSVAAGCIVRTANKQYDFSLRQSLENQKPLLIEKLHEDLGA